MLDVDRLIPEYPWNRVNIQVGRLRSHPSGIGWRVMVDLTTWIEHDDGSGLTLVEAERALDQLDEWSNREAEVGRVSLR